MATEEEIIRMYQPPSRVCKTEDGRCEDLMLPLFIYCIIVPAILVLIILLVLIIVMCCSRKSCKCKKYSSLQTQNDAIQMDSYNTIRRASANLRHMSNNRETPIMSNRSESMTLDRSYRRNRRGRESCHSAPGTLQRQNRNRPTSATSQNVPPPPPAYSLHSDDVFLGPDFLPPTDDVMHSSVRYEDSPDHNGSGAQSLLYHHHYNNDY